MTIQACATSNWCTRRGEHRRWYITSSDPRKSVDAILWKTINDGGRGWPTQSAALAALATWLRTD